MRQYSPKRREKSGTGRSVSYYLRGTNGFMVIFISLYLGLKFTPCLWLSSTEIIRVWLWGFHWFWILNLFKNVNRLTCHRGLPNAHSMQNIQFWNICGTIGMYTPWGSTLSCIFPQGVSMGSWEFNGDKLNGHAVNGPHVPTSMNGSGTFWFYLANCLLALSRKELYCCWEMTKLQ